MPPEETTHHVLNPPNEDYIRVDGELEIATHTTNEEGQS